MRETIIKRLSECTLVEALEAWNKGFEGYFIDATMTLDAFLARMVNEGLSPALSVVAFVDGKPAGIVLNGVRTIRGDKIAWNGGTGVAQAYRGQGIGKKLMQASLDIYREEKVNIATLEAIRANAPAIELYKRMGYSIVDRLAVLQHKGMYESSAEQKAYYVAVTGRTQEAARLPFYEAMTAWQTQWPSIRDGELLVLTDTDGQEAAYCLYRHGFDSSGAHVSATLFQCVVKPGRPDRDKLVRCALAHTFGSPRELTRRAFNLPLDHDAVRLLLSAGFELTSEQVMMTRMLE
ncbi:GNAT family N-acetyltransferase [Paenibacillus allorhizosphaerae]|uniref:N-acetyltransferase domain-containing protein n=1 Tax=Paenibacillus allorhizosphaerae TaxID=2849866 RepID=A0ABM8VG29_9BACL|nr:GNAT family N-acetyltransferase [Paenibacillus allorhizosphaerae]CAG7636893.1 hypothetical protein PAECIP111802_02299 [Paenibacillus allorhizosphaerae]